MNAITYSLSAIPDSTFHRTGGSEGSEQIVVHDVTITVS